MRGLPSAESDYHVVVIGGGQAGLAAGYFLRRAGVSFTLLDGGHEAGASWRERWDSLRLFTPARYNALPGLAFPGPRYALPGKDQVADYLAGYARAFDLPLRLESRVTALAHDGRRFVTSTQGGGAVTSRAVIVATGANQQPHVPAFAPQLDPRVAQLHSSAYRRPDALPQGKVLVVGAGNSGVQIALELAATGREVVLSGRDTGFMPRRLLGRDIYDWLWPTLMRPPVDSFAGRRLMQGRLFSGDPLIGILRDALERAGVARVPRITGVRDGDPVMQDGKAIGGLASVVWCTGFRPDYAWIELPVFGLDGYPSHRRGVASRLPGLGFVGMRFQHRLKSALLGGVGEDAAHVVAAVLAAAGSASAA